MVTVAAPPVIDVTTVSATPPAPFGLFSVATFLDPTSPHWFNGIRWQHPACANITGFSATCGDAIDIASIAPQATNVTDAVAAPFTLIGTHECSPVGTSMDEAMELARAALLRHQQEAVEGVISSADLGVIPNFVDDGTTDFDDVTFSAATNLTAGGATNLASALSLLADHAAATYGQAGTIHAPRVLSSHLANNGLVARYGDHLETLTGELVAVGAGYSNLGPSDDPGAPAAGEAWLFVTPPVFVITSDEVLTNLTDQFSYFERDTNDMQATAMRPYIVGWDNCPVGAALVTIPAPS